MIDFGYTLQSAREAKGLTIAQIAETTRLKPQQIEDLENENFSRIAAPIYGRGFVKLYCEAVGIDPKPLVAEFMDIFSGNRAPTIRRRRATPPPPAPAPTPPPPPPPTPLEAEDMSGILNAEPQGRREEQTGFEGDLPDLNRVEREEHEEVLHDSTRSTRLTPVTSVEEPSEHPTRSARLNPVNPVKEPPEQLQLKSADAPARPASRYAPPTPIDEPSRSGVVVPGAVWRILALAVVSALILYGLYVLAAKVWRAATVVPPDESPVSAPAEPTPRAPDATPRAPRTPLPVPPLYID